jgi:Zn-dependent peptidase ImmA (M78 family)
MSTTVSINPQMLSWAITRAGKTLDDLITALPKLPAWLNEEAQPTVKQLEAFSRKVHLPFGYLFLAQPPNEVIPFPYFRQGERALQNKVSLNVFDTILNIQQRQQWLSEYLQEEGHSPLPFVGRFTVKDSCDTICNDIRNTLGLHKEWAADYRNNYHAMAALVQHTEEAGVIVVINGIVGNSTNRRIESEECRGFVMVDKWAPFLFINNTDAEGAKMFTLIHELAHIWLGKSAGFDTNNMLPANDPVELLCDRIAAEFLVPKTSFETAWRHENSFTILAKRFKVSKLVIARRALDLDKISRAQFFKWYNQYKEEWQQIKAMRGGGDFYNNQPNRVSLRFAALVNRAVQTEKLSYRDAYRLTGLNGDSYQNFINKKLR